MNTGIFVVFEGIDGAGKTTQAGMLAEYLAGKGKKILVTRDPGGTPLGEALRNVILYCDFPVDPLAETLIYAAARAQHVAGRILPALQEGAVVISDRYADSMYAYQGWGRGIEMEFLDGLIDHTCRGLVPDITILLDMEPSVALSRLKRPADRMEREGLLFLQRVRNGYLNRAEKSPPRYAVINAAFPAEYIALEVRRAVDGLLGRS